MDSKPRKFDNPAGKTDPFYGAHVGSHGGFDVWVSNRSLSGEKEAHPFVVTGKPEEYNPYLSTDYNDLESHHSLADDMLSERFAPHEATFASEPEQFTAYASSPHVARQIIDSMNEYDDLWDGDHIEKMAAFEEASRQRFANARQERAKEAQRTVNYFSRRPTKR